MALTVTEWPNGFTFQRDKNKVSQPIAFAGTWSGTTPVRMEYQLTTQAGTAITPWMRADDVVVGTTTLSLKTQPVPQWASWYKINFRTIDSAGAVINTQNGTNVFGVGVRIWMGGQSNIQFWSGDPKPAAPAFDYLSKASRTKAGSRIIYDLGIRAVQTASVGPGELKMNDELAAAFNCVVCIINLAVDGSALNKAHNLFVSWHLPQTWAIDPGYNSPIAMADLEQTGGIEFGVWQLGETEAGNPSRSATMFETAEHFVSFKRMVKEFRSLSGSDFPVFIFPLGAATIGGLSAAQEDAHSRMRGIFSKDLEDKIHVIGWGSYPYEHNGANITTWSLDAGNIWQTDDTYAGKTIGLLILDGGFGVEKGAKGLLAADGDWFFDVGVTNRVFLHSSGGDPDLQWVNKGAIPVVRQEDQYHLTRAGYEALSQQVIDGILSYFRHGAPGRKAGPHIENVRYGRADKTVVDLHIQHDFYGSSLVADGGALRTSLFRVEDDGVAVAITSATIIGGNLIRIVLGAAVTGLGTFAHITRSGYDAATVNAFAPTPIASPTSGPCKDDQGRYLRPLPLQTEIEAYKGIA